MTPKTTREASEASSIAHAETDPAVIETKPSSQAKSKESKSRKSSSSALPKAWKRAELHNQAIIEARRVKHEEALRTAELAECDEALDVRGTNTVAKKNISVNGREPVVVANRAGGHGTSRRGRRGTTTKRSGSTRAATTDAATRNVAAESTNHDRVVEERDPDVLSALGAIYEFRTLVRAMVVMSLMEDDD